MTRIPTGTLAVAALAAVCGAALVADAPSSHDRPIAADLFDPSRVAAGLCGGDSRAAERRARLLSLFGVPAALAATQSDARPPLLDGLGTHSMPITAASPEVQAYFDQGVRLMFGFNHAEAIRAFKAAQAIDPGCAMCFWGESLSLGVNINVPMDPRAVPPAWTALQQAVAALDGESEREKALVEALKARYSPDPKADRAPLDAAYADAMKAVHERFPEDHDIAVFYAEAAMDTQPWDYWEADRVTPSGRIGPAIAAIEKVLAAAPDHPGAIHLYIHLTEASADPWRAEAPADRLAALMPGQGHIVHMPSHTYYRIGRFRDSLASNVAAAAADEAYIAASGTAEALYANAYYPHNVHFLLTSALMAGDHGHALSASDKLAGILDDELALSVATLLQPMMTAPYVAHAQFSSPADILALPEPGAQFPFVRAHWHYARAVAKALGGDARGARAEADAIAALRRDGDLANLVDGRVPAPQVMEIAELVARARAAQADGDHAGAVALLQRAVALEDELVYMEPPYWTYPTRQSLGAALLRAGRADEAAQAFRDALVRVPGNGWALYGLQRAYEAAGEPFAAAQTRQLYREAWAGDADPDLNRL
jgi:tetratricopeptide (TPR) repeat protein